MTIKLKDIIPAPWNTRGEITPESVAELAASIREQGIINPITLWHDSASGDYLCIAGNRRLAALRSLGITDLTSGIDCMIFGGNEHDAKMVTVTENLQREDVGIIEEAALVGQCLDDGMTADTIAARTGRSTSWVNRRRKLLTLDDAWKSAAIPADALERIASYPAAVQKSVAKGYSKSAKSWNDVRWAFERESRDLDDATFDTAKCRECLKRTGVEADLFGVANGELGSCLDCKCFEKSLKDYRAKLVADAVGDAEAVDVGGDWNMPREFSPKKSKKHPCAYYYFNYEGKLVLKWGESKEVLDARKASEDEAEEKRREADNAERACEVAIIDRLEEWKDGISSDDTVRAAVLKMIEKFFAKSCPSETSDYIAEKIADEIESWHSNGDWVNLIRAFDEIPKLAGIDAKEIEYLLERHADDGNGDDND